MLLLVARIHHNSGFEFVYDTHKLNQEIFIVRVISANVNGIRAAEKKGFFEWLKRQRADVVCLQETKAQFHQADLDPGIFCPKPFHCYYHDAQKKGYSGVAIYSRVEPDPLALLHRDLVDGLRAPDRPDGLRKNDEDTRGCR